MSTLGSTPLAPPPIPASALPNGGSRPLTEDVFQTAEEAVLVQGGLPDDMASSATQPGAIEHGDSRSIMSSVRTQVAAKPYQAALLAAGAGALAMWILRRSLRGRIGRH